MTVLLSPWIFRAALWRRSRSPSSSISPHRPSAILTTIATIRESVTLQLEDTPWLRRADDARRLLHDAGFGMYHARDRTSIITLRKPALQRLILQCLQERPRPSSTVHVHVLIRFLLPDVDIPTPPRTSLTSDSERDSRSRSSHGLPSEIRTVASESSAVPASDTFRPVAATPVDPDVATPPPPTDPLPAAPVPTTFRGHPVDIGTAHDRGTPSARYRTPTDDAPPPSAAARTMFDSGTTARSRALVRTPTRNHPFSAEVTFGAETFEEYMTQFMYAEVKFKDFRKAVIPKFDSQRQDSFVHWYKLFCSTCLQWGVWCPPYESAQEDMVHGAWWNLLPASVRQADRFMSGLIYSALILDSTFPAGTREYSAVEGCPPNAGYHALYALLRLHHPLLHSVLSTANEIPKQRRTEQFGLYIRRLQDFMARERMATRTYTESEALDLAVRNLLPDWRAEFRRMVERDKRTGPGWTLPTGAPSSVAWLNAINAPVPVGLYPSSWLYLNWPRLSSSMLPSSAAMLARLSTDESLGDSEIDFVINAITNNQAASSLCLGCHQPGHTLADCNRFVDYIVAESLAQRNPQLKAHIAASHQQFRSRLTAAHARGGRASRSDAVRSLQLDTSTQATVASSLGNVPTSPLPPASSVPPDLHLGDDTDDLDDSFPPVSIRSVTLHVTSPPVSGCVPTGTPPAAPLPPTANPLLLRRLAATYDDTTSSSFAHADNGSMACTTHDAALLFAYRPLARPNVRLFDAGQHAHTPVGVGFLRIPVADRGIAGGPSSVFVRTYYTPTIPGIIVSHSAIAKQLGTNGYNMSSSVDAAGFIHFPHRLRRCQDVYIRLQPTSRRGGLTFTDALLVPSTAEHLSPYHLPRWYGVSVPSTPRPRPSSASPSDDTGPLPNGCGATAADHQILSPPQRPAARVPPDPSLLSTQLPSDATPNPFPCHESPLDDAPVLRNTVADPERLIVRSLNRSALRMLWHQRLGHLNFRRLSDMHRFVKGFPKMSLPTELDSCPICLAAKMRKTPAGTTTTMKATTCYQGLSIDFGFMPIGIAILSVSTAKPAMCSSRTTTAAACLDVLLLRRHHPSTG
ncbi:hypothetical protein MHU86_22936 [Fragilaria crotonensis]|nr:hypothetical protein MHU86_22936 [Fragilaria crotonensis]